MPDAVKSNQAIGVFMKYADDHPEELHHSAPLVVWEAMRQDLPLSQAILSRLHLLFHAKFAALTSTVLPRSEIFAEFSPLA